MPVQLQKGEENQGRQPQQHPPYHAVGFFSYRFRDFLRLLFLFSRFGLRGLFFLLGLLCLFGLLFPDVFFLLLHGVFLSPGSRKGQGFVFPCRLRHAAVPDAVGLPEQGFPPVLAQQVAAVRDGVKGAAHAVRQGDFIE